MQLNPLHPFRDIVEELDNRLNELDNDLDHIKLIAPDQLANAQRVADLIKDDLLWLKQTIINKRND
jgi:hypothetical protein